MEAQTFLQYAEKHFSHRYSLQFPIRPYQLSVFYSTPFSLDVVHSADSIFKGWKPSDFKNDFENLNGSSIALRQDRYIIRKDKDDPFSATTLSIPETLDDFIRDCQRAGVMLFWKDEIAKKYFL